MKKLEFLSKNGINLGLLFFFGIINFLYPMVGDDLGRGAHAALYNHSIVETLTHDYYNWTGRMSANFLAYIFFNEPYDAFSIPIFNILNSVFLVLLFHWSYQIVSKKPYKWEEYLFFVFLLSLLCTFNGFFRTAFWKTAGLQYIWGMVLIIWFIKKEYFRQENHPHNIIFSFIIGLFIGLYNEIFFALMMVTYIFALLYYFLIDQSIIGIKSKDSLFFSLGNLIGGFFLVRAPGNYIRQQLEYGDLPPSNLIEKLKILGQHILESGNAHILMGLMLSVLFIFSIKTGASKKMKFLTITLIAAYALNHFLLFLPIANTGFAGRKLILSDLFLFILLMGQFMLVFKTEFLRKKWVKTIIFGLTGVIFSIYLAGAYHFYLYNRHLMQQVVNAQAENIENPTFKNYLPPKAFRHLLQGYEFAGYEDHWAENAFARYYHFKTVKITSN